jgi:hypothetical protein
MVTSGIRRDYVLEDITPLKLHSSMISDTTSAGANPVIEPEPPLLPRRAKPCATLLHNLPTLVTKNSWWRFRRAWPSAYNNQLAERSIILLFIT